MRSLISYVLLLIAVFFLVPDVHASTCRLPDYAKIDSQWDVIFHGRFIKKGFDEKLGRYYQEFSVLKNFKGAKFHRLKLYDIKGHSQFFADVQVGDGLVLAKKTSDGLMTVDLCSSVGFKNKNLLWHFLLKKFLQQIFLALVFFVVAMVMFFSFRRFRKKAV